MAQDLADDVNGNTSAEPNEDDLNDNMPQDLSLGELDITSTDVSLKGTCLDHNTAFLFL